MKRIIYFFSGTGNSLELAAKIAEQWDASLEPLAAWSGVEKIDCAEASVGVVFPTYMYRPPLIVTRFFTKLMQPEYLFLVAVNGGDAGDVLERSQNALASHGIAVHAGFKVRLPDNYAPFGGPPSDDEQEEMFAAADPRAVEIVRIVSEKGAHREPKPSWLKTHLWPAPWYALGYWAIPTSDKNFTLNDRCNGCESCAKACPVGNITMEDGRPVWHGHCEQCFACLQWCQKEAIDFGKKTIGVRRYHNPRIKLRQIVEQKKRRQADA